MTMDESVANWMHAHATPTVTGAMRMITTLGAPWFVTIATLMFVGVLLLIRERYMALQLGFCVTAGMLLNTGLKNVFDRARPNLEPALAHAVGFSFPSGHVAAATLLYGCIAVLAWQRISSLSGRVAVACISFILVQLVALSRVYLVVHYLTDVVVAQVVAVAWLAVSLIAFEVFRRRRDSLRQLP